MASMLRMGNSKGHGLQADETGSSGMIEIHDLDVPPC